MICGCCSCDGLQTAQQDLQNRVKVAEWDAEKQKQAAAKAVADLRAFKCNCDHRIMFFTLSASSKESDAKDKDLHAVQKAVQQKVSISIFPRPNLWCRKSLFPVSRPLLPAKMESLTYGPD